MAEIALPRGHHYAVMWGIPDNYAGMTNSMLHRSRSFVALAGTDVTILTYEHRDDYDAVRARLRERGGIVDGMHIANLWEDLRSWDDGQLKQAATTFDPGVESTFEPLGERGDHASPLTHVLTDDDGRVTQVDYFRADGTLLGSDRRDVPGDEPRAFTLCDTSGEPLGGWLSIWGLYHCWLDSLPRDPVAWMIADSKTSANHLADYRRDDVVTLHVVHGSHLEPETGRPMGTIRKTRQYVLERLDQWDAVVFLTRQQLEEVDALLGTGPNRHVIPHGRFVPKESPKLKRSSRHGVMLTSLTKRKQISHAIKAMDRVGRLGLRRPTLDVWGEGPYEEKLKIAIEKTDAPVELRGYSDQAAKEFDTASFSLLTSNNEAFGLVLVESMGHGCIPISYDMPYGPGEIITHGVDGFLVPPDDIAGLATEIRRIARAKSSDLAPIREAAYRRALEFNDEHVTAKWAAVMEEALASKRSA
ncbi:glycosyltransferase [Aeromicrobium sp.]|uniref:glycosyltransferase n=1 Tax=Aeromicrobium sp. TaxID=1871063 RepID=UPI003C6138F5